MTLVGPTFDLVVAANRLPVERVLDAHGVGRWHRSPGGLVTALDSVMQGRDAAWVGWSGEAGPAPAPFRKDGLHLIPVGMSPVEIQEYYEGFSNETLWPIYHDVIVPATFHRAWWNTYRTVNHRFAQAIAEVAAPGARIWVHDYQLQLVPAMVRELRPDVRIGWFNHIPFPPVQLFAQLPWRRSVVEGLLGGSGSWPTTRSTSPRSSTPSEAPKRGSASTWPSYAWPAGSTDDETDDESSTTWSTPTS